MPQTFLGTVTRSSSGSIEIHPSGPDAAVNGNNLPGLDVTVRVSVEDATSASVSTPAVPPVFPVPAPTVASPSILPL
jgi:hypothetical protein